jgi:hypothetical protein
VWACLAFAFPCGNSRATLSVMGKGFAASPLYMARPTLTRRRGPGPCRVPPSHAEPVQESPALLSIAYAHDGLGLGPDSPWDDCRGPGILRLAVCGVLTRSDATHSGIRASLPSTSACALASPVYENAPLPPARMSRCTASVHRLSPGTLSVQHDSTSELLRTLQMMAASKPTSWLSERHHALVH